MFSTPRVTDHTDFSFSRVERNEVTHDASLLPTVLTKNKQENPKRLPSPHSYLLSLQQAVCHVLVVGSLFVQTYNAPYSFSNLDRSPPMRG